MGEFLEKSGKEFRIGNIPAILWGDSSEKIYIYVHGYQGCKEEAELFAQLANSSASSLQP